MEARGWGRPLAVAAVLALAACSHAASAPRAATSHPRTPATGPATSSAPATPPRTSTHRRPTLPGPNVTLAYAGPGVGVVGTEPGSGGTIGLARPTLWLTRDFVHWRDVTPPGAMREQRGGGYPIFETATFLDAGTGWVTTWSPANVRVTVYRTADGGTTWTAVAGGGHSANAGATERYQLVSPATAFSESLEPTAPAIGLSVTTDSGAHWKDVYDGPPPRRMGAPLRGPFDMPMTFVDAELGFAADGVPALDSAAVGPSSGYLFVTRDGGRRWTRAHVPMRQRVGRCVESDSPRTACLIGLPRFSDDRNGVVAWAVGSRRQTAVGFDRTADAGQTWHGTGSVTAAVPGLVPSGDGGMSVPRSTFAAVADATTWWVVSARRGVATSRRTTDGGGHWLTTTSRVPGQAWQLIARDATHAWLTVLVTTRAGGSTRLLATRDGGRTWRVVVPASG